MNKLNKNWLLSTRLDLALLFVPVWLSWIFVASLPSDLLLSDLPLWGWVLFVLLIDVTHVWSTVWRTYFDAQERDAHSRVLWVAPLVSLGLLALLASFGTLVFWRCLAYLALFHFIKQQYGFMAIYSAKHGGRFKRWISDRLAIYVAVGYPVLFWHLSGSRVFNWFYSNDFFDGSFLLRHWLSSEVIGWAWLVFHGIYWFFILGWLVQEVVLNRKYGFDLPRGKMLWLLTTATNWFLGIIWFNSDVVFSVTNVVAHGIPYMVLVFFYVEKKRLLLARVTRWNLGRVLRNMVLMLGVVLALALLEEYAWDVFVNREKGEVFAVWFDYPLAALEQQWALSLAVCLLALPQVTHYVLDGFIWKSNASNPFLKPVLFSSIEGQDEV